VDGMCSVHEQMRNGACI